jgi:hypothetical protein
MVRIFDEFTMFPEVIVSAPCIVAEEDKIKSEEGLLIVKLSNKYIPLPERVWSVLPFKVKVLEPPSMLPSFTMSPENEMFPDKVAVPADSTVREVISTEAVRKLV